jgi:hypothetical protein
MLNLGSYLTLEFLGFGLIAFRIHEPPLTWLLRDIPVDRTVLMDFTLFDAPIAGVTK